MGVWRGDVAPAAGRGYALRAWLVWLPVTRVLMILPWERFHDKSVYRLIVTGR